MDFLEKLDKQKLQRISLIVIAALTFIATVLLVVIIIASVEGGTDPLNDLNKPNTGKVNDIEFINKSYGEEDLSNGSLVLVNNEHYYNIPSDIHLVNCYDYREQNKGISESSYNLIDRSPRLEATAMENAHKMLIALGSDTQNHSIMISSAFRTYEDQVGRDIESGYSDHHTGLLLSLTVYGGINPYLSHESNIDLANWLNTNAHKYGFVVRYPADKTELTGVSDYTHAYRYVGVAHATYMKEENLCLEEYIEYLKNETSYKDMLTVKAADGSSYAIYYTAIEASGGDVKVPVQVPNPDGSTNYPYTVSGTNEGGIVITIKLK